MSKSAAPATPPTDAPKKPWMAIILAVAISGAATAAGVFFWMKSQQPKGPEEAPPEEVMYVEIEKPFVWQFKYDNKGYYGSAEVTMTVNAVSEEEVELIKGHMPRLRSEILKALVKDGYKIMEEGGAKELLEKEGLARVNEALNEIFPEGKPIVSAKAEGEGEKKEESEEGDEEGLKEWERPKVDAILFTSLVAQKN